MSKGENKSAADEEEGAAEGSDFMGKERKMKKGESIIEEEGGGEGE